MTELIVSFAVVSILIGFFISYIWSSNGALNVFIKMVFSAYTVFALITLISVVVPVITASGMRVY